MHGGFYHSPLFFFFFLLCPLFTGEWRVSCSVRWIQWIQDCYANVDVVLYLDSIGQTGDVYTDAVGKRRDGQEIENAGWYLAVDYPSIAHLFNFHRLLVRYLPKVATQ